MAPSRSSAGGITAAGIITLTLVTATIHLQLSFPDTVFILNGLGYLSLLAAFYLPMGFLERHRYLVHWTFIGYTALTVILWILIGARTPIGYIDKVAELMLIALLVSDMRRRRG